ncbi:hypothetical protein ACFQWA_14920 [Streptomyces thermogriseus]|uniref:hypothetical protein n=1 Tax=Streptomyces thermogriseus TaxID=75292 RepID=UPI00360C86E0
MLQYHGRSDRHSQIICWGILFDLMLTSDLLRWHVESGKVVFGINHTLRSFSPEKKKRLDLVLCRPKAAPPPREGRIPCIHLWTSMASSSPPDSKSCWIACL